MNDDPEQLHRYVEELLRDGRPARTPLPDETALRARQTAAMLRAVKPGVGLPSNDFVNRVQHSIMERLRTPPPAPVVRPSRRSLLLAGAAGIAAGVAVVAGIDRLPKPPAPSASAPLVQNGNWKRVSALADLPEGTPVAFRSGAIEGFLIRRGGQVDGRSAVCPHMGCILNYSKFRDRFECPCHGAIFSLDGEPVRRYTRPLRALPSVQVRVQGSQVEVYTV